MPELHALAAAVGERLAEREETIATAESATGGLISSTLTAIPGASRSFERGYVTYTYRAKLEELAVSREALDAHGAVSAPVAEEMAQGARDRAGTDWALSLTGIAGPSGETDEKPVGTTYIGLGRAGSWGSGTSSVTVAGYTFDGDRETIRKRGVEMALQTLLEAIE